MYEPIEKSPEQAPTYQLHMNYNHQLLLTVCAIFCMKTIHLNIILLASHVLNIFCPYQNILECVINSIRIDRMGVHLPSGKPQIHQWSCRPSILSFDTCIYLRGVTCTQFFSVWHRHGPLFGLDRFSSLV